MMSTVAYIFPNGFAKEATDMYGWLRHYNLTPSWSSSKGGESVIMLPDNEISALVMMQKHNPARFGNPKKYPIRAGEMTMDRMIVAAELVKVAKDLAALDEMGMPVAAPAALVPPNLSTMDLSGIAGVIGRDWRAVNYGAKPYLSAMFSLGKITDEYGMDSGSSIVAYFLANATSWRGEVAKAVKKELNRRLKTRSGAEVVTAGLGRREFEALANIMKNTGVNKNKRFVEAIVDWLEDQNPMFDEDRFVDALK